MSRGFFILHRIIFKHINPNHPRKPNVETTQQNDDNANNRDDSQIESFFKKLTCD